jgi:hypothetical protein
VAKHNHLTPSEIAEEFHMDRQEVIGKCLQMDVPIYGGHIDKYLFELSLRKLLETGEGREVRAA